jgi:hypothetical protein
MRKKVGKQAVVWLLAFLLTAPMNLMAQSAEEGSAPEQNKYTQEQLDRLLAPIALYSDSLLAQILMASTYPLEVVEADRWLKEHPDFTGERLDDALRDKSWDASVKSLCHFPRVLATMSENLTETGELGNAFLEQKDEVMDTIQNLRAKARAEGHLESNDKQRVIVEGGDITIEPAEPDVIYIPTYNPCWVYGAWWYPICSPPWFWSPGLVVGVGLVFGPAIFVGRIGGWCGFYWHRHHIFVNVNKTVFFNRVGITKMHGGVETWRHNPYHRRGLAYFGSETRRRYGPIPHPGVEARHAFRGFRHERERETSGRQETPERLGPTGHGIRQRGEGLGFSSPRPRESRRGNVFEGFGRNGNEIRNFSERGRESMDHGMGRGRVGGDFDASRFPGSYGGGRHR